LTRLVSPSSATRFVWHLLNKLNLMARFIDQISGILRPQRLARCAISPLTRRKFLFILLSCYKMYDFVALGSSRGVIETSKVKLRVAVFECFAFVFLNSINVE
jgi:hypothetical protein